VSTCQHSKFWRSKTLGVVYDKGIKKKRKNDFQYTFSNNRLNKNNKQVVERNGHGLAMSW